jgi:exopolysaccharide biosynthesis polyprenyl glycosylphosphotransferase
MIDRGSSVLTRSDRPSLRHLIRLPLNIAEWRLLLMGLDVLAVNGALLLALAIRTLRAHEGPSASALTAHPWWFIILTVLWLAVAHAFDVYEPQVAGRLDAGVPAIIRSGLLTCTIYLLIPRLTPALPGSRVALVSFPLLVIAALVVGRRLFTWALPRPAYERRALIVGAGWAGRSVAEVLVQHAHIGYSMVGFVDDDPAKVGASVFITEGSRKPPGGGSVIPVELPVLGNRRQVQDLVARHRVSTLILAITRDVDSDLLQTLMDCVEKGVEMIPMPVVYEQLTGRVPVEHVGEKWYVAIPIHPKVTGTFWGLAKRAMDVVLASVGLVCLAPVLPVIALAIILDSPGPVFYLQKRVGKSGTVFRAVKFRSMVLGAEQAGAMWAQKHDPRATRVGRILRATHLDEFPQFVNVLKGEMSIVGPRPERPELVERLAAQIPIYRLRHIVKPGMGGWGLVRQGYAGSQEDALIRLQYDLYYIKHQSLWLDLLIILKTIMHAVTLKGR